MNTIETNLNDIQVNETGGAFIGGARATWPFAKLTANRYKLQLNASILGNLVFGPGDIISIEPVAFGVKINHRVDKYKQKVIFQTSNRYLIDQIRQTGFLNNTNPLPAAVVDEISQLQQSGAFPLKTPAAIAIGVIWNAILIPGFFFGGFLNSKTFHASLVIAAAPAFIVLLSLVLLVLPPLQKLILKPGRSVDEIKIFLFFSMIICGVLTVVFGVISNMPPQPIVK